MHIAHMRNALIATAALAGLPAFAGTTTLPGTLCTSDAAVGKSVTGLMVNKANTLGPGGIATTTYFVCPILRTQSVGSLPTTLSVRVNVKTASSNAAFECFIRSVLPNNATYDSVKMVFPTNGGGDYASRSTSLTLPGLATSIEPASVNMRCNVPNVIGGVEAGIVSYTVEQ